MEDTNFKEGYQAFATVERHDDNPYPDKSTEGRLWSDGWAAASRGQAVLRFLHAIEDLLLGKLCPLCAQRHSAECHDDSRRGRMWSVPCDQQHVLVENLEGEVHIIELKS
jgi:hypothetical protein